jgi:hypothetical protein
MSTQTFWKQVTDAQEQWANATEADGVVRVTLDSGHIVLLDSDFVKRLRGLPAKLKVRDGRVVVVYSRFRDRNRSAAHVEYPLERLVVARLEDYWSVKLKRCPDWFDESIRRGLAALDGTPEPQVLDHEKC